MEVGYGLRFFVLLALVNGIVTQKVIRNMKPETLKKNAELCQKFLKEPNFDIDQVIGKPWRIYYTWNMKLDNKCVDITFKNATPMIVQRFWNDMYDYLETQPNWDAATLHMSMGKAGHEMLLFADQGPAGSFRGVPNVLRDGNLTPNRKGVPLLKFHMKLLRADRFLVNMDCQIAVGSLSARADHNIPYRTEIESAAAELDLGTFGFPACLKDKNKDEQFFV